ncbi:MAG: ATP-binding protein, partial [Pirellulaceae bacterium]
LGLGGSLSPAQERFENPTNDTSLNKTGDGLEQNGAAAEGNTNGAVNRIEEKAARRWYPVIDYSRCTNCLECIDFCLFGVYGVDRIDTILVEQPDNCRKGCPACSRVCPENAIIFPQHKTPAIAGSAELGVSLKIDLSQLFGAPDEGKSAEEIAAQERDEQLILAGRNTVGMQGLEKRQAAAGANRDRDDLDDLVDQLDELDI